MSDTNVTQDKQKAAKVRRKPEFESVLTPTFAAARHSTSGTLLDRDQQGSGLLQRQCACGTHTIGGGECDACRRKEASFLQRTSATPTLNNTTQATITDPKIFPGLGFTQDLNQIPLQVNTYTNLQLRHNSIQRQEGDPQPPTSGDRFDALLNSGPEILRQLNPADELGEHCQTNCPATAAAIYHYLQTGQIDAAHCDPVLSTGRYRWVNTTWSGVTPSLSALLGQVSSHGRHIVVEGRRYIHNESETPQGWTPHHYFVIVNIRGTRYVVDAFGNGQITPNINGYMQQNLFRRYRYVTGNFQVAPEYNP